MYNTLPLVISPPRGSNRVRPWPTSHEGMVPWSSWQVLVVLVLFAIIQVVVSLVLSKAFMSKDATTPPPVGVLFMGVVLISHAAGWLMAWILVTRIHGWPFVQGLGFRRWPLSRLAFIFGAAILVYGLAMLPALAHPPPPERTNLFLEIFRSGGLNLALLLAVAVIFAPLMEEVLFRGLLFPALRRRFSFTVAALHTTLLFTALHFTQTGSYWPAMVGIFLCGACLAWLRERTGSLWPPVVFHMGFNTTPFLAWLAALPMGGIQ